MVVESLIEEAAMARQSDTLLNTKSAAERLGVTPRTIARWAGDKKKRYFPNAFQVNPNAENSAFLIPVADIEAFEELRRQGKIDDNEVE